MDCQIPLPRSIVETIYSWRLGREMAVALFNAIRLDPAPHVSGPFGATLPGAPSHLFRWEHIDPADPAVRHVVTMPLHPGDRPGELVPVGAMHHTEPVGGPDFLAGL